MSSKAARRKAAFRDREIKRKRVVDRQRAICNATDIEQLARAMGIKLK